MRKLELALLLALLVTSGGTGSRAQDKHAESRATVEVVPDRNGTVQITDRGRIVTVPQMASQTGIEAVHIAADGRTAGWLADFKDPDSENPYAGELVIWRGGRVIRVFLSEQSFYSWSFNENATLVAYHTGPRHGETVPHCELHDIKTGRQLAQWDGDLDDPIARPSWAAHLSR